jgi:hypothetical protein
MYVTLWNTKIICTFCMLGMSAKYSLFCVYLCQLIIVYKLLLWKLLSFQQVYVKSNLNSLKISVFGINKLVLHILLSPTCIRNETSICHSAAIYISYHYNNMEKLNMLMTFCSTLYWPCKKIRLHSREWHKQYQYKLTIFNAENIKLLTCEMNFFYNH